ncbi:hypothetical protein HNV08_09485 [Winogradskyella eckloniae]|uniref:DUF6892 domain-containing protein n=1 Tax=Winogradskyella eckloniae TaxID=1089306 RepID=UPI001564743B|nr:hypothetical protein [Winogradskyella eckloniae]NRD20277.1 hypothetical protein [Winogradskyella eckloniae]
MQETPSQNEIQKKMRLFDKLFGKSRENENQIKIDISQNGISINQQQFDFPFSLSILEQMFGKPERIWEANLNKQTDYIKSSKCVWDNLGISVHYNKKNEVIELNVRLSQQDGYKNSPEKTFQGELTINGSKIDEAFIITVDDYLFKTIKLGEIEVTASLTKQVENKHIWNICIDKPTPKPKKNSNKKNSNKYKFKKISGEKIEFKNFNFKLAIIEELMYTKELLIPKFNVYEFLEINEIKGYSVIEGVYEPIPEVVEYFKELEIDKIFAEQITEIYQYGGNNIYMNVAPQWSGEDDTFDIESYEDVKHFPNLKKMRLFNTNPKVINELKAKGIDAEEL